MPTLSNKTILILSPQNWGKMLVSKHHYALELARQGNKVYFLNPPEQGNNDLKKAVEIHPVENMPDLSVISHRLWFPYVLKFHALPLFHAGMRLHIKKIIREIGQPVDIVWSFDLGNLYPFRLFGKETYKIFHPVDEPLNQAAIDAANGADIIFSVTREILEKYGSSGAPKYFINHGVSHEFILQQDQRKDQDQEREQEQGQGNDFKRHVKIGFSGNLLRPDIDRKIFLEILSANRETIFECWGSYASNQSNIGGTDDQSTADFITALRSLPNVILHGAVPAGELANEIRKMDAFLICYDIKKDQSGGTNYHKIMEYISTGKVIISNNVTTYQGQEELVQMTNEREDNLKLPDLFKEVIGRLDHYNSPSMQKKRLEFAKDNTYKRQIERIEFYVNGK
ncbi:glycosyltransferase family protein [Flavitalea flava]